MTREELLKVAKPILFNTEMTKAILDGRKTVTRRNPFNFEMKEGYNPKWSGYSLGEYYTGHIESGACLYSRGAHDVWGVRSNVVKPRYKVGDILYVRETFCYDDFDNGGETIYYKADYTDRDAKGLFSECGLNWHPSIHMPKEAARIFLKVTDVRVEQIKDITEKQALAEGFTNRAEFLETIFKIYPDCTGESYLWVIEFERVEVEDEEIN